ncbi:MAG: IclR family transcriptional regulator [Syntrophorhabdales bacterium]|jgi:DNA-binding IclR family transcriptional regulator
MKPEEERAEKDSASSLVRGLKVLECFGQEKRHRYTLSELARRLDMPKSSIYRVLKTLARMDYLRYEEHSKHYYLGVRVLSLGFAVLAGMELREIARPYMEMLSRECNKTVNLTVLDGMEMVYVERISVRSIRAYNISVGSRIRPWNSAAGKALLAYLEPSKVSEMIAKAKKEGVFPGDEKKFLNALEDVRNNGFAASNQEERAGIVAVAAPVFSSKGVAGAINLVAEPEEVPIDVLKTEYAPKLMKVGSQLSEALGYRG